MSAPPTITAQLAPVLFVIAAIGACEAAPREALDGEALDAATDARADRSAPSADGAIGDGNGHEDAAVEDASAVGDASDASSDTSSLDAANEAATDSSTDGPSGTTVTLDGVIGANEYGAQVDGQNQQTVSGTTWLMTWTDTHLYVAVTNAELFEAAVLYISTSNVAGDAGTAGNGAAVGQPYDSTELNPLPVRASFVAYAKDGYNEWRAWDGAAAWGNKNVGQLGYASSSAGNKREIAIPWSLLGGKPTAFTWLGYVTTGAGFVYGEMPPDNPSGSIGLAATFPYAYRITDATTGSGTKPFSVRVP